MKITQWFTHPQAILGVYLTFFFQMNTIGVIIIIKKNVLAFFFFAQKVHPSIIKELHMALVVNKGLLKQSDVFVYEKYPYLKLYKP